MNQTIGNHNPCFTCINRSSLYVIATEKCISGRKKMTKEYLYTKVYGIKVYCDKHILNKPGEIWTTIPESYQADQYMISNLGRLKNINNNNIHKGYIGLNGYVYYTLCIKIKRKPSLAHRLVALTFLENPDNLPYIDHIDKDKTNNKVSNLRWSSPTDNNRNRNSNKNVGARKRVKQLDLNGKFIKEWESATAAANFYQVVRSSITTACSKHGATSKGFIWKYSDASAIEDEIWKRVELNTKFVYQISNKGRIKNMKTNRISIGTLSCGYRRTQLKMSDNKRKNVLIHRLVMKIFVGESPIGKNIVNHIDENKENNYLENLEYVSPKDNVIHSISNKSKEVYQYTLEMELVKKYPSISEASRKTGLSHQQISDRCQEKVKSPTKFIWSFVPLSSSTTDNSTVNTKTRSRLKIRFV